MALGIALRSYSFEKYKTKKKTTTRRRSRAASPSPSPIRRQAEKAWSVASAVAEGVAFARDLVNEPANALGPVEFADS